LWHLVAGMKQGQHHKANTANGRRRPLASAISEWGTRF